MEELSKLHPAVACTLIVAIASVVCVFIYQFWKTVRET
jgi:hypothetical protein